MKVLISTDAVGSVFGYTRELAVELNAQGVEVVVATMGARLRRDQREQLPGRVHESGYRLEWMDDPWDEVAAAGRWLLALEEEEQPDIVHLSSYSHAALPFKAAKVLAAHTSVLAWWRAVHGAEAPREWDHYREQMAAGLDGADAVVVPTAAMLRELEHDHELRPQAVTVIHAGSSTPLAPAGVEKRPLVLGSERLWDPARRLETLDLAAANLAWPVTVAGELGPMSKVHHAESTGALAPAALAELRRSASIFVSPTVYEPSGLGIIEAARDRCALVLGYTPSLRELWSGSAIFIQPDDEHALHEVLKTLIDTPRLRNELARLAQDRATELSIHRTARSYRELYGQLAGDTSTEVKRPNSAAAVRPLVRAGYR
ncbi:MAG TPA: glycosyltransferase family 4 protein [Solirubrobacterales bacterium]